MNGRVSEDEGMKRGISKGQERESKGNPSRHPNPQKIKGVIISYIKLKMPS